MSDRFRITLAQLNPVMGDLEGNAAKARDAWQQGRDAGADLVALPEMFIVGYNPQDLVMKPAFQIAAIETVRKLAADCADGPALAIGGPWVEGAQLFNAYFILKGGKIANTVLKHIEYLSSRPPLDFRSKSTSKSLEPCLKEASVRCKHVPPSIIGKLLLHVWIAEDSDVLLDGNQMVALAGQAGKDRCESSLHNLDCCVVPRGSQRPFPTPSIKRFGDRQQLLGMRTVDTNKSRPTLQ